MATFKSKYSNAEIEEILERTDIAPFALYYDAANKLYRFFATKERRDAWIAAYESQSMTPEIAAYEFTGSFTAPAPYTINFIALQDNQYVLSGSKNNCLTYSFQTVDGNGGVVNESVDVYYTFKSPGGTKTISGVYNAGTSVSVNIDDYLSIGTNSITILIRGRSTGVTKTTVITYYVFELSISSTFDIAKSIAPRTNFSVTYTVVGQSDKTVEFYIDGTLVSNSFVSSLESSATRTQVFSNSDGRYAAGKHTLQIQANMMGGNTQYYTDILYYEFVISGKVTQSGSLVNQTQIMIEERFPSSTGILKDAVPGLTGEQYVSSTVKWAYYSSDPLKQSAVVTWRLYNSDGEETTLATRNADVVEAETDRSPDPLSFMPTEYGNFHLQALIGGTVISGADYTISVIQNTAGIIETTEGMTMKLSGLGRSNTEPSETLSSWTNNGYTATFYNQPWNGSSGWNSNALWLNNGAYCRINNKPFAEEIAPHANNGCVVEIDFETFNIDDDDAVVFNIGDPNSTTSPSLYIKGNKAVLRSRMGTEVVARFKSDERVKLAFIVCPNTASHTEYPQLMFIQNNGVLAPGNNYNIADTFNIGSREDTSSNYGMINIGNSEGKAGIKIYYLRTYDIAINMYEELYNYFIDGGGDIQKLIAKNSIYTANTRNIDVDKLEGLITTVKITGPMRTLLESLTKSTITAEMEVTCPFDSTINFSCGYAQLSNAGQSTLGLPVPSMHVKLDKNNNVCYDRDGKILLKNRWAFRQGNCPEKKFRLQANYMDSSGCHNGAFFRLFNEVAPKVQINGEYVLRTPAQDYAMEEYPDEMKKLHGDDPNGKNWAFPYNLHMVPDSIPCVVVWRESNTGSYNFLGQYVIMEEKNSNYTNCMRSIYDNIDIDGNPDPFKFKTSGGNRLWNNEDCRQFEILRNSHNLTLFTSDSQWDDWNEEADMWEREQAFELEYPDEDDILSDYASGKSTKSLEDYWAEFKNSFVHPVCSTYNRQTAFNAIYGTLLNRWHFAAYYCLMLRNCCVDSVVRNMELTTYDMKTWLPKWWDVDMECGLQQSGACDAEPCSDRSTVQKGNYVFAGRDNSGGSSWLWDALEACPQFQADVKTMDAALYAAGWTYSKMTDIQDEEYIDSWSQSIYNESGLVKYIDQYLKGNNYLTMLQGDRTSHRHWFLKTSYDYFDALNVCGEYRSKIMYLRARGAKTNDKMYFKAGASSYFGWGLTQTVQQSGIKAEKGETFTLTINVAGELGGNDPINIYAANKIEEADFSEIAKYLWSTLEFDKSYDAVTGTLLKKLIVGITKPRMAAGDTNLQDNISFTGLNTMTRLEEFNIQGLAGVNAIDLSSMTSLKRFYASGSGITSFDLADGASVEVAELPLTITSMTMNGCSLTNSSNHCAISWWNRQTQSTLPTSLKFLNFSGMGSDIGTHELIIDWLHMLEAQPTDDVFAEAQITYYNIFWTNVDIEDLFILAKIPSSQRKISGYIKCNDEFTTEEMNRLMAAFGENIFTSSNNLIIDCDSNNIIISATGTNTSINLTGGIEVLQGSNSQLQAVGFPILGGGNSSYVWSVYMDGSAHHGNADYPWFSFDENRLHYSSGVLETTECSNDDISYTLYVENPTTLANGYKNLIVKKRTYPSAASLSLTSSTETFEITEGVYQILQTGTYTVSASHTPAGYSGTLSSTNGGDWTLDNYSSEYITKTEYGDSYLMQVKKLPDAEKNMTMHYTSNWKNGLSITASPINICLIKVIERVLTSSGSTGNPVLFSIIDEFGIEHADPNVYTSLELKNGTGTINFKSILDTLGISVNTFKNLNSEGYNVLNYLKNISGLNLSDCIGLNTDISIAGTSNFRTLNLSGTTVNANIGAMSPLVSFTLGTPTYFTVNTPNQLGYNTANVTTTTSLTSVILNQLADGCDFSKLNQLYEKSIPNVTHVEITQKSNMTDDLDTYTNNHGGRAIENLASLVSTLDSTSFMSGKMSATRMYEDSRTELLSNPKCSNLTIEYTAFYVRWADRVFENAIANSEYGDTVGITLSQAEGINSFGTAIKNKSTIANLTDLYKFKNLTMPTRSSVSDSDFYGCSGLQYISFPQNLVKVGSFTFVDMPNILAIDFTRCGNLTAIEQNAFSNCTHSIDVNLTMRNTGVNCILQTADVAGLTNIKNLIAEDSITLTTLSI